MKTKIKIDAQRLRNLTTGRLHTKMEDIYADLEMFTDTTGIMTHMLPNIMKAVKPYLINNLCDISFGRFLDGKYDPNHTGTVEIERLDDYQKSQFWKDYSEMDSPLTMLGSNNKNSSVVTVKPATPPSPKKCQAQMVAPVIRKICDKLEELDFKIVREDAIELQFSTTMIFIENIDECLDLYIDGVLYSGYNNESGKLLYDTYKKTIKLKNDEMENYENKRKLHILELGIKNILQS